MSMLGQASRGLHRSAGRPRRARRIGVTQVAVRGPVEHTIVELSRELDFTTADEVVREVESVQGRVAAIDVSGLEFVDASGVRALQYLRAVLAQQGAQPRLDGASPTIRRTIALVDQASRHLHAV